MKRKPDCIKTLEQVEMNTAFLTGFSTRIVAAIIHLREAWVIADVGNQPGIEIALRALFRCRSLRDRHDDYRPFLVDTLGGEQAAELWSVVTA
jgi:hypothetical protein